LHERIAGGDSHFSVHRRRRLDAAAAELGSDYGEAIAEHERALLEDA
jgi:hypothetical protein